MAACKADAPRLQWHVPGRRSQVELQRKMLQEYERREASRKVSELQALCPELTPAAAQRALDVCNGRYGAAAQMFPVISFICVAA